MKLSMWMIANRLSQLDLELNIRENVKPALKSARRVYATNCVHLYEEGDDVICNGEGDTIRMKDMQITEAFEIVQSVFDFYEDWHSEMVHLIESNNYQEVVNICWIVFQNPMILFDGNCKVLGISKQYSPNELDEEWKYLNTYGYSSIDAINYIKFQQADQDFYKTGLQRFEFEGGLSYSGVTYSLYFNETLCGRINLLEKDRLLNPGDYQILHILADLIRTHLAEQNGHADAPVNNNMFHNLLNGNQVDKKQLEHILSYYNWRKEDTYQIYLIEIPPSYHDTALMGVLAHTINRHIPSCFVIKRHPCVVVLCNITQNKGPISESLLTQIASGNSVYTSSSLPRSNIFHIGSLLDQAQSSLYYGHLRNPKQTFHTFYQYAMDYIIEAKNLSDCVQACHPDVWKLWKRRKDHNDDMFTTLKCYLNNERSLVQTAQALFIHRNTLVYRVKKLNEFLSYDLDDVYTRDYMKLSFRTLELYELKLSSKIPQRNKKPE